MAGTISISPGTRWSAATWLFDWIVEFLAENIEEAKLRATLQEIVDENLGWLELSDFGPDAEHRLRKILHTRLVDVADSKFSPTMPNRADALAHLQELADEAG
jgi:hypothetical protein